ncbi:SRPBCC family protein [Actinospongicola halichondriae]|uniref:SRPBCC family protein n=1 Tax=Actinospongicola halichondriae TaxID=3236844 RepID=UPI003D543F15
MSREIELEVEVPGTVDEVWQTIATGPGVTSWFIPMSVEERAGGEVVMDFGDHGSETATVAAWEPPHRVVFEGSGERALAYEWLVEARDGGTCVVRLVNSGFGDGADWDGEYDGMSGGWRIFLEHLRIHLTHFRGRRSTTSTPSVMVPGPNAAAWRSACAALGVDPELAVGDHVTTGDDTPGLSGVVESMLTSGAATAALLLLDGGVGTAFLSVEGDGDLVATSLYLYRYAPEGPDGEAWRRWLADRLAPSSADPPVAT